jgi:hypothetical protein
MLAIDPERHPQISVRYSLRAHNREPNRGTAVRTKLAQLGRYAVTGLRGAGVLGVDRVIR